MNEEEYLKQVEARNSYCNCPELSSLFSKRWNTETLEDTCSKLYGKVNPPEKITEDNVHLVRKYSTAVSELKRSAEDYYRNLDNAIREGRAKFVHHDRENGYTEKEVSYEDGKRLLKQKPTPIISIHCSSCNKQFDVADI